MQAPRSGSKKHHVSWTSSKRRLIVPNGDKRYVRRDAKGRIKESDEVGRASASDRRKRARTKAGKGHGDRGDR
jgi:hypothetical protein